MANDSLIPDQPSSTGRDPLPSAVPAPSISPEPSESQTLWRVVNDVQTFSGKKGKGKNNAAQQKQVGGVGEAYGQTLPGKLERAKNAFDDVKASVVGSAAPAMESAATVATGRRRISVREHQRDQL